jgi:hypothetical protein
MRILVAALTAAAMLVVPVIALLFWANAPESAQEALVVYGLVAISIIAAALHVYLAPAERGLVATGVVLGAALNAAAVFGVFIMYLVAGSCDEGNSGHVPIVSWTGGIVLYLAPATWFLLGRPLRPIWGVPVSVLLAGAWLVVSSIALTGSTGVCLD